MSKAFAPVHALFNNKILRRMLVLVRIPLTIALIALVLPLLDKDWFYYALAVSLVGEVTQMWCFSSLKKQKILAVKGPYCLCRNPMYLGRYFIILGVLILIGDGWGWKIRAAGLAIFTILYYFYMYNRVRREEKKLAGIFGEPYEEYCKTVNRFLPSFKGTDSKALWFFQWELLNRNHGLWNCLALLAVYALFSWYLFVFQSL
jgi:protein-S-isoprenylcysteine O-methyltransferase Ste14